MSCLRTSCGKLWSCRSDGRNCRMWLWMGEGSRRKRKSQAKQTRSNSSCHPIRIMKLHCNATSRGKESSLHLPPPQTGTNWVQTQVHTKSYLHCSNLFWTASVIHLQRFRSLCLGGLELTNVLIWWHLLRRKISGRLRRLLQILFGILHQVAPLAAVNVSVPIKITMHLSKCLQRCSVT